MERGHPSYLFGSLAALAVPFGFASAFVIRQFSGERVVRLTAIASLGQVLLAVWAWHVVPQGAVLIVSLLLSWFLLTLAVIDFLVFRLPDVLTLPLLLVGLAMAWFMPDMQLAEHVIGAVLGYGFMAGLAIAFRRLRGIEGLGQGDTKLAAAAGAWLGWQALPTLFIGASVGGILWFAVLSVLKRGVDSSTRLPFGVPLATMIWLIWLYGPLVLA